MSDRCPVCKARLWKKPFAWKLHCPRCGAEFRPTVPLALFQLFFFVFLVVVLALIVLYTRHYALLSLMFLILAGLLAWFLPKAVRLEVDEPGLTVADGPSAERLDVDWEPDRDDRIRIGHTLLLAVILGITVVVLILARYFV